MKELVTIDKIKPELLITFEFNETILGNSNESILLLIDYIKKHGYKNLVYSEKINIKNTDFFLLSTNSIKNVKVLLLVNHWYNNAKFSDNSIDEYYLESKKFGNIIFKIYKY